MEEWKYDWWRNSYWKKEIELPKPKRNKDIKKETKDGVDIYIDRDKEIMYISMNEKNDSRISTKVER